MQIKLISDKKSCALGLILRVRVFGTRKWLIIGPGKTQCGGDSSHGLATLIINIVNSLILVALFIASYLTIARLLLDLIIDSYDRIKF